MQKLSNRRKKLYDKGNYTQIENEILKDKKLSQSAKLAYVILCMHSDNDTDICYPSYNLLTKEMKCSKTTVIKAIKELVHRGYIEKTRRKGFRSNVYAIKGSICKGTE